VDFLESDILGDGRTNSAGSPKCKQSDLGGAPDSGSSLGRASGSDTVNQIRLIELPDLTIGGVYKHVKYLRLSRALGSFHVASLWSSSDAAARPSLDALSFKGPRL
jgi:hypothetical protein